MKAKLEFDLDDENCDDRSAFEDAVNGTKWKLAMWELDQYLRSKTKYASDETHEEYIKAMYDARDKLHEILSSSSLNLN